MAPFPALAFLNLDSLRFIILRTERRLPQSGVGSLIIWDIMVLA